MIQQLDITHPEIAEEVWQLQRSAYLVEAQIVDYNDIPPLKETVSNLQLSNEIFFGYRIDQRLCGVISYKTEAGTLDIHRLFVHPNDFRKGIAQKLIDYIIAHERNFHTIIVSTGSKNMPAVQFYIKNGFKQKGIIKITDNFSITSFIKHI